MSALRVPESQARLGDLKDYRLFLARLKRDLAKVIKLLNGTDRRAYYIADIELNYLFSCSVACVLDRNAHAYLAARVKLVRVKLHALIFKRGIGKSLAEEE